MQKDCLSHPICRVGCTVCVVMQGRWCNFYFRSTFEFLMMPPSDTCSRTQHNFSQFFFEWVLWCPFGLYFDPSVKYEIVWKINTFFVGFQYFIVPFIGISIFDVIVKTERETVKNWCHEMKRKNEYCVGVWFALVSLIVLIGIITIVLVWCIARWDHLRYYYRSTIFSNYWYFGTLISTYTCRVL